MIHQILAPPYPLDALEPYFDTATMHLHVEKHHQGYADKLNAALNDHPNLQGESLQALLSTKDRGPITNFAGGVANHNFFWSILSPQFDQPIPKIFDPLIPQFTQAATKLFGSGWVWIVQSLSTKDQGLSIISTPNQDSPLSQSMIPILALDLWEHSYYLKYQNRRAEYIEAFWHLVNWTQVENNLK